MNQTIRTPETRPVELLDSQLWQSLQEFRIDEPGTELNFVSRLAEENHWQFPYAERVFDEYKRFLYLAIAAEHPASPSDAVDQAWHLHLAYTRSYWDELCGKVLKRPLHHLPTIGGRNEDEKHSVLYLRTLESYERVFGQPAPPDIWPRGNQQVAPEKFARIRTSDFWLVRKPSVAFRKRSFAFAGIITLSSTMAACSAGSVGLFPMLFIGAIVAAIIYAFRNKLGNGGDCSSSCSGSSCSSGSGFFSFFSSGSSDSDSSDSGSSDSGSGDSGCSSNSCSSCSSCSSD